MNEILHKIEAHLTKGNISQELPALFTRVLYWGAPRGLTPHVLNVGAPVNTVLTVYPVAQLSGLPVLRIDWNEDNLPDIVTQRAVHKALKRDYAEYLLCYVTAGQQRVAFVWTHKRAGGKTELRTILHENGAPNHTTIEQLAGLAFSLDELAEGVSITAVTDKLNNVFVGSRNVRQKRS